MYMPAYVGDVSTRCDISALKLSRLREMLCNTGMPST